MTITEADITRLVTLFYARVRQDEYLAPIFIGQIGDNDDVWDVHIQHIADFWSSIFLKTKRFSGNPMRKHLGLPGIAPQHFKRWLEIFEQSAKDTLTDLQARDAMTMVNRIAQSLQMGLAFHHEKTAVSPNPFSDYSLLRQKP